MTSTTGRLIRLEERLPKGCPTCLTWEAGAFQVSFQGDDAEPIRAEDCPTCGRHVPLHWVVFMTRADGPQ